TRGSLIKSIYAINGNTSFTSPVLITAGDTVTYRLQYALPASDIFDYKITDFLPLPVFPVGGFSTTFDPTVSAAAPPAGQAKFGPADTFFGISNVTPTVTPDTTANSIAFDFGTFKDLGNRAATTDILLTVRASNQPFADGLFLTNQARETEGSVTGGTSQAD